MTRKGSDARPRPISSLSVLWRSLHNLQHFADEQTFSDGKNPRTKSLTFITEESYDKTDLSCYFRIEKTISPQLNPQICVAEETSWNEHYNHNPKSAILSSAPAFSKQTERQVFQQETNALKKTQHFLAQNLLTSMWTACGFTFMCLQKTAMKWEATKILPLTSACMVRKQTAPDTQDFCRSAGQRQLIVTQALPWTLPFVFDAGKGIRFLSLEPHLVKQSIQCLVKPQNLQEPGLIIVPRLPITSAWFPRPTFYTQHLEANNTLPHDKHESQARSGGMGDDTCVETRDLHRLLWTQLHDHAVKILDAISRIHFANTYVTDSNQ